MKYIFSMLLAVGIFSLPAKAQQIPYTLTIYQSPYNPITGGTPAVTGVWDDPEFTVNLPFPMSIYSQTFNQIYNSSDIAAFAFFNSSTNILSPVFMPYGADLIDRGYDNNTPLSPITYQTTGNTGDRIFKMQWSNAGFYDEGNPYPSSVNFQMWFYENGDVIELHFGPSVIATPNPFEFLSGPLIGFFDAGVINNLAYLQGNTQAPDWNVVNFNSAVDTIFYTLNGAPPSGTVYRFSPLNTGVGQGPGLAEHWVKVYPSLTASTLNLSLDEQEFSNINGVAYSVLSADGRQTGLGGQASSPLTQIPVETLPSGLYWLRVQSDEGLLALKRFVRE